MTTPRVALSWAIKSSMEMVKSRVEAEMVMTAVPLVGTMELMVMMLAWASAKMVRISHAFAAVL